MVTVCPTERTSAAEAPAPQTLEQTTTEWVKTRSESVRLDTEWRNTRQLLEATVAGLKERAETLEAKRDFAVASSAKDRTEIAELEKLDRLAAETLLRTDARARALSERLLTLRKSLPPRLSSALELSYRSLAAPEVAVAERMKLNLTILNRCTQFNRTVSYEENVIAVDAGAPAHMLEVLYWGLSHAYALDRQADKAWLGSPGPDGWHWQALPTAVAEVKQMIAIQRDEGDPAFVRVPAQVFHTNAARPTTSP